MTEHILTSIRKGHDNMKKIVSMILVVAMVLSMAVTLGAAPRKFSDVASNAWYKEFVDEISSKGIIEGYKGKFSPNSNLTVDQLIKIMVVAAGKTITKSAEDTYWASPYIRKMLELGWVKEGEFDNYTRPITRGETARIISRALGVVKTPIEIENYSTLYMDYNDIDASMQKDILNISAVGIIQGVYSAKYNGLVFGANNKILRCEVSKMIVLFLNPSKRVVPAYVEGINKQIINGFILPKNKYIMYADGRPAEMLAKSGGEGMLLVFQIPIWTNYKLDKELKAEGIKQAREILLQKIDPKTVDAAIAYANAWMGEKTTYPDKEFKSGKYTVIVGAPNHNQITITFSVWIMGEEEDD